MNLLKKDISCLKRVPKAWYSRIDDHLFSLGFEQSVIEVALHVKRKGTDVLIVSLYIDDLLVTENNVLLVEELKKKMLQVFEMINLGLMSNFLGVEISKVVMKFVSTKRMMLERY